MTRGSIYLGGNMNIAKSIDHQISFMKSGALFSYQDIPEYSAHSAAVVKALSRKLRRLEIVRLKKGLYYKPVIGRFGIMSPKNSELINYFTLEGDNIVGYVTGLALYHHWGLTTQVPSELTIATSKNKREKVNVSGLRISTIPARTQVTKNNIIILQFLDILKNVDQIPDAAPEYVIKKLSENISNYKVDEIHRMEMLVVTVYAPRTRALLGAFLETYRGYYSALIYKALNPTSKYKTQISPALFKNMEHWHLKN